MKEEGDFKWLSKNLKGKLVSDKTHISYEIWEGIQDSYIKIIGRGKQQNELTELKRELLDVMCKRILTGEKFMNNDINRLRAEISDLENEINSRVGMSQDESILALDEARIGKEDIDPFKLSVKKYYQMTKRFSKKVDIQQQLLNRR